MTAFIRKGLTKMKDLNEFRNILDYLKQAYSFEGLYHYTNFSNLKSIFKTGHIYSRSQCCNGEVIFKDAASQDVIHKTSSKVQDFARFYFTGPSITLYVNEGIKKPDFISDSDCPIPVGLVFDEKLVSMESTYFSDGNARSEKTIIGNSSQFFQSIKWDKVFAERFMNKEEKRIKQAELLSREPVSLSFLKKVYFRSVADKRRAINLLGNKPCFSVEPNKFSKKNKESCKDTYFNIFIQEYYYGLRKDENDRIGLWLKVVFNKIPPTDYILKYELIDLNGKFIVQPKSIVSEFKYNKKLDPSLQIMFCDYKKGWHILNIYLNGVLYSTLDINYKNLQIKRNSFHIVAENRRKLSIKCTNSIGYIYDSYINFYDEEDELIDSIEVFSDEVISYIDLEAKRAELIIDGFICKSIRI